MKYLPTRSALLHSRFLFSIFLLPIFVFALSQTPQIDAFKAFLVFLVWHFFIYPASNGYNSYFDKDEGSIALLEKPPETDKSLYVFSLSLDFVGIILASFVSVGFAAAALTYGVLSKMYSHPSIRLKRYPIISFLVVFIFQGSFVYWSSYLAMGNLQLAENLNANFIIAGIICSCLIGASYPLTQVYQHEEDRKRGDHTLSILLGINGSFLFSAALFGIATALIYVYWKMAGDLFNFWMFLVFIIPVLGVFISWIIRLRKNRTAANYKNMSKMTWVSGIAMLSYFLCIWLRAWLN